MSASDFLAGGGVMGARVRAHNWSASSLGSPETWPQSLRTALSIMLNSAFPSYLAWGPDLISFYNDAYIPIMEDKPDGLGRPFPEVWSEVSDQIGPITACAMRGEASYFEDWPLELTRKGFPEQTWFTFSYSPIRDETGGIGGVLCTVHETTARVRAERERERLLTELAASETRLAAAVDLAGLFPYSWDPATGVLEWDARLKAMWGLPPDAHVDTDVWRAGVHPEDRPRVEAAIAHCLDPTGDGIYHIEYRVIGINDGVERWVSTRGRTLFNHGWPTAFIGTALDITERKRAEQALHENEERFRHLTNLIPTFVWYVDPVGTVTFANEQWYAYTGIRDEPPEQWPDLVFHPGEQDSNVAGWTQGLQGGVPFDIEARIRRHDGQYRWYLTRAVPVRNNGGQITGWFSAATDIHDRKLTEERRRESEAYLRLALEAAQMGVWEWDTDKGLLKADAVHQSLFGFPPQNEPRPARLYQERILPDGLADGVDSARAALASGGDVQVEQRVIRPGGEVVWVLSRGRKKPGDPSRMIGISFDVTERKRAEERFREFAAHSTDVLWIVDTRTRALEYLSPAFEKVWGAPCDAFLQDENRWMEAVYPDDRARVLDTFDRATLGAVAVEEYRIIRPDGAVRWIRNTVFPICDEQGQMRRVGGIAQDITRQDGHFAYIIDANESSRQSLSQMLRDRGYDVRTFPSGTAFLEVAPALMPGCVVLDIRGPEAGGLGVPRELRARRIGLPVIVLGEARGDVTFAVQIMKAGAVDFLPVPYDQDQLLAALASAAADLRDTQEQNRETDRARTHMAELSEREREVLDGLLAGKTNKEVGREMGISPRTVETHRAHVMQRLGAKTVPEAVRIAGLAGVQAPLRSVDEDP